MKEFEYDDLRIMGRTVWERPEAMIRLPNDRICAQALNGPCRTYHLGKPMCLQQLEAMPKDLQLTYLRKLRRHGGSADGVSAMLGITPARLRRWGVCFDRPDPAAWEAFVSQC